MLNTVKVAAKPVTTVSKIIPQVENPIRNASYISRDTKAETTSHKHAAVNPILGKNPERAFQHPTYTKNLCEDTHCENKLCKETCGPVKESVDVGHATHSAKVPKATYIADVALNGDNRPQYGVFYENPVPARAADIANTGNQAHIAQLNTDEIHLVNIHANAKPATINNEIIN